MVLITRVTGAYKPTYNWGAPHCTTYDWGYDYQLAWASKYIPNRNIALEKHHL